MENTQIGMVLKIDQPFIFSTLLIFIVFLSNLISFNTQASSQRLGVELLMVLLFIISTIQFQKNPLRINRNYFNFILAILIVIFVHYLIALPYKYEQHSHLRFVGSVAYLSMMALFSAYFCEISLSLKKKDFHKLLSFTYKALFIIGCIVAIMMFIGYPKKNWLIGEPGWFAIIVLPFLMYIMLTSKRRGKVIYGSLWLLIALMMENLTLLVGVSLVMLVVFLNQKKLLFFIGLGLFLMAIFSPEGAFIYYSSRLDTESSNLSMLAYMSGYERTVFSLMDTNGIGIGFSQLGHVELYSESASKIFNLIGYLLNNKDGSTIAFKMISELGLLSIVILLTYFYYLFHFVYRIYRGRLLCGYIDIFYISIFIMFIIPLFIRGTGYFSPSTFLFLSSIYYWSFGRKKYIELNNLT